jgi:hypothetical protein
MFSVRLFEQPSNEGREEGLSEIGRAGTPLPAGASDKNENLRVFVVKNPCSFVAETSVSFCRRRIPEISYGVNT